MKGTTGIYDPSLGNRSNETSGVAIKAREAQSDTGTVRSIKNFMLAERQIGRILLDLIQRVYDTERMVQAGLFPSMGINMNPAQRPLQFLLLGVPSGIAVEIAILWLINKLGLWDWHVGNPKTSPHS
jgi:hypothetical protein